MGLIEMNNAIQVLSPIEAAFKQIHERHPHAKLNQPHGGSDLLWTYEEAAGLAPAEYRHVFEKIKKNSLSEEDLMREGDDTSIYRHIRYLPAILHSHDFIEIEYVLRGTAENTIQGQSRIMNPGDLMIIAPGTVHALSVFSDECIVFNILLRTSTFNDAFFSVMRDENILSEYFYHVLYGASSSPVIFFPTGKDHSLEEFILYAWQEYTGHNLYREQMLNSIITAFFILLLRAHGSKATFFTLSRKTQTDTILILKYIQSNYRTLTLDELSVLFNYSNRQIQRLLKNATDSTFSEIVKKLKIQEAVRLLTHTDLSIENIITEVGYSNATNFRSHFRHLTGHTPMEIRKKRSTFLRH